MYHLLLLLILSAFVEPHCHGGRYTCQHRRHHDYHRHREDRFLEEVARDIIDIDRKVQNYCSNKESQETLEIYGVEQYKLVVRLPGYTEDDITVKVKYRVIYINARREDKSYTDVRLIPDMADGHRSTWNYVDGELNIDFRYNIPPKIMVAKNCGHDINDTVVIVPKSTKSDYVDIDIRFGVVNFEEGTKSVNGNHTVLATKDSVTGPTIQNIGENVV